MKVLRVLDLENASGVTDKDMKKMLKQLPRLKFLSLRGCRDIRNLPSSVGHLRQLQILDLRNTSIVTIPVTITKLEKLQYLRAGTTVPAEATSAPRTEVFKVSKLRRFLKPVGVEVTSGVGKLTMLHTLGDVNVPSAGGKYILKEIKNLSQLRKLAVFGVSKENMAEFTSVISGHSHLQSLSVWFNKDNLNCLNGKISETTSETPQPPKKLQTLKLYGLTNTLPMWINRELCNLRKINFEMDILSEDVIRVIGVLPELCILRLRVKAPTDGKLNFRVNTSSGAEDRSYKKVKILEIACTTGSLEVTFGSEAMQHLELLKAGCCIGSCLKFTDVKHLSKLKEVYIIGSHDDTLKMHLQEKLNEHPLHPRLENDQSYSFPFY